MTPENMTPEEQARYIEQRLRELLAKTDLPETREDILASNQQFLDLCFKVLADEIRAAKEGGVKVSDAVVEVRYRFDHELEVGKLEDVSFRSEMEFPHPLRILSGFYSVEKP